jgi:hypothetical protein
VTRCAKLSQKRNQPSIVDAQSFENLVRVEEGRSEHAELTHRGPSVEIALQDVEDVNEEVARRGVAE